MSNDLSMSWGMGDIDSPSKVNGKLINDIQAEGLMDTNMQEESGMILPNVSLMLPKRFEDSQDQEDFRNADIPNGHNNPDAVDIIPRPNKSFGELLQADDLPDTELISSTQDFDEGKKDNDKESSKEEEKSIENSDAVDNSDEEMEVDSSKKMETSDVSKESIEDNENESLDKADGNENNKQEKPVTETENSNVSDTDSFKLELSQSQYFAKDFDKEEEEDAKSQEEEKAESKGEKEDCEIKSEEPKVEVKKDEDKTEKEDDEDKKDNEVEGKLETEEKSIEEEESAMDTTDEKVEEEDDTPCKCTPSCHSRMHTITKHLDKTKKELEDFIKLKKEEYVTDLTTLVRVLANISAIAHNKATANKAIGDKFYEEVAVGKGSRKKSRGKAAGNDQETPAKKAAEKKEKKPAEKKDIEPLTEASFKSLKGLAVFAKWPNSGWFYPGIIEGLVTSDWKKETNVTVKFYDGLVREMKNVNILPASLIPPECVVCDLEDETEMVVVSSKNIDNNNVEFTLQSKDSSGTQFDLGFNKLAIRATHMRTIKQQIEPNTDVSAKKLHMVSLDNLVSGRRSRGRISKEDGEESGAESSTPRKGVRKSVRKFGTKEEDEGESTTPAKSTPNATKRRASGNDKSAEPPAKRTSTSKRTRQ